MNFNKLKSYIVNILDVSIIIIVVAIIISSFFKLYNKQIGMLFEKSTAAKVSISVLSDDLNISDFKIGEKVYDDKTKSSIGEIVSIKNIKEKHYTAINNTLIYDYLDKNIGVLIEIDTKIKEKKSITYIGGFLTAAPGQELWIYTENGHKFVGTVDEITSEK